MSIEESIRIVPKGQVALVEWDLVGEKVNKLSTAVMRRLKDVVEELKNSNYGAVVMISRKERIFIAGADIEEIKRIHTKEDFNKVLSEGHEILNALEDLPMPVIAAVQGACMGGGCELILACDYRLAADDEGTKIGLPETKLGIIPGFGGCVRMPRVVGLQNALDIILAGKAVEGKKAARMGLVDDCVPAQKLEEMAMAMAEEAVAGLRPKRKKYFKASGLGAKLLESFAGRPIVYQQAKKQVLKTTKGFYPAPLKALEVISQTYGMSNREKALAIEQQGFIEVAVTEVSKNLIDLFYMMEAVKKQTGVNDPEVKPRPIRRMAVLGAGTMGGGIAYVAANKDIEVRLKDINNAALSLGFRSAREIWEKGVKRRKLTPYQLEQKMSHISGGLDYAGFSKLDLVVEAIVEDMDIKKKVIGETVRHLKPDAIVATNTSSLSVTEMSQAHPQPENFVGMHFFNPVDKMPLVEVIRGEKTSDEAVVTIFELSKKLGKTPVVVKDGPGFLVNRLLMPWMIEGLFLLEDGMSIQTVDRYYTHKFGMPMGPYRLMDEVGLDVCLKVVKIFKKALGERVQVPEVAERLAQSGRLGRKNGRGFYLYDSAGKEKSVDESVYVDLALLQPKDPLTEKECLERGIFQMINEGARALVEDHIVEKPQDVDLAMIMGTGFPPFRGGLLRYADTLGSGYIVQELEIYASRHGARFKPCQPLVNMSKADRKFYS